MKSMTELWTNVTDVDPEEDEEEGDSTLLPQPWFTITIVVVGVAIVVGVAANVLVLLSYRRDRHLRTVHNLYLVHMAISDVTISAGSMPLYLIYTVTNFSWPFGPVMCKMFLVMDYTMCNMSVLTVVLVAWNQLALIRNGARYDLVETKCKAYVRLAVCWVHSFMVFSPAILFWDVFRGHSVIKDDECDVEFYADFEITLVTELTSFGVPCLLLIIINTLIFLAMTGRRKQLHDVSHTAQDDNSTWTRRTTCAATTEQNPSRQRQPQDNLVTVEPLPQATRSIPSQENDGVRATPSDVSQTRVSLRPKMREHRAGMILLLLVVMLLITWLPYSIMTIWIGVCQGHCFNEDLYEVWNWILWFKSCFNPFLYAFNSPRFRENFFGLLSHILPGLRGRICVQGRM